MMKSPYFGMQESIIRRWRKIATWRYLAVGVGAVREPPLREGWATLTALRETLRFAQGDGVSVCHSERSEESGRLSNAKNAGAGLRRAGLP
jgi:hypothetical protein